MGLFSETVGIFEISMCLVSGLISGVIISLLYMYKTKSSKSFTVTLAVLPVVVSAIILMVNGNLGAGVAVAGAFSLVRFRSLPGTAKEISAIFLAMATGLAIGMGYIYIGFALAIFVGGITTILNVSGFGESKSQERALRITIPEDLNFSEVFDDLFEKYTKKYELNSVKTSNLGSLFKLEYVIEIADKNLEKEFIDELRIRNGNLEIMICKLLTRNEL